MAKKYSKMFDEDRVLLALQRYYIDDITFEKAAHDAGITIYEMIEYTRKNKLPVILTDDDRVDGIKRVSYILEKRGLKSALSVAEESYKKRSKQ